MSDDVFHNDLSPSQSDAVRRSLAAARHDGPLPDEVAARLDARLADLVAERPGSTNAAAAPAPVVQAAERFRRRNRRLSILVAAAAVTVLGVAVSQVVDRSGGDATTAESSRQSDGTSDLLSAAPEAADAAAPSPLTTGQLAALREAGFREIGPVVVAQSARATCATCSEQYNGLSKDDLMRDAESDSTVLSNSADARSDVKQLRQALTAADCRPEDVPANAMLYPAQRDGVAVVLVVLPGPEVSAYSCRSGRTTPVPLD